MVTPRRKKIALGIAALADAIQIGLFPGFVEGGLSLPDDALDAVVALALLLTLGWRWRLVGALALELVPGVALFPSWTMFVATLPTDRPGPYLLPAAAPSGTGSSAGTSLPGADGTWMNAFAAAV